MQVVADKTLEITQHLTESEMRKHALHCKAADGFQRERVRLEEEQLKSEIEASFQRRRELTRVSICLLRLLRMLMYADVC